MVHVSQLLTNKKTLSKNVSFCRFREIFDAMPPFFALSQWLAQKLLFYFNFGHELFCGGYQCVVQRRRYINRWSRIHTREFNKLTSTNAGDDPALSRRNHVLALVFGAQIGVQKLKLKSEFNATSITIIKCFHLFFC